MDFKELREKTIMGNRIRYHINASGYDMTAYMGNMQYKSIRCLSYDGDIYMWPAGQQTHAGFITDELNVQMKDYSKLIDISLHCFEKDGMPVLTVGKSFMKDHEWNMERFMKSTESKYNGRFEEVKGVSGQEHIYTFVEN